MAFLVEGVLINQVVAQLGLETVMSQLLGESQTRLFSRDCQGAERNLASVSRHEATYALATQTLTFLFSLPLSLLVPLLRLYNQRLATASRITI